MREITYPIPGGSLTFTVREGAASLSRVSGLLAAVRVPERIGGTGGEAGAPQAGGGAGGEEIEGVPVTSIERKAFLGQKALRRVTLPETVREIGDWAFASCSGLREIGLPAASLGKGVFAGCESLRAIRVTGEALLASAPDISALLAAAAPESDAAYLLRLSEAGEDEWLRKYDARILKLLREPDQEGFSRQILCGEEDYGSTDLAAYESGRRMRKAENCLLRLLYDRGLQSDVRERYRTYLMEHLPGSGSGGGESWRMLKERHAEDRPWYERFVLLGCVTDENRDALIADLGEDHPELKAYLMKTADGNAAEKFFDALAL